MPVEAKKETLGFQSEAKQLLHLMIHSLYSNKEIFLRELISNASDAIDKLRFDSLSNAELLGDDAEFRIKIDVDKEANTITITDNGVGMSRDDAISHRLTARLPPARHDDPRARLGQRLGDDLPDPLRGPGDHGDLTGQIEQFLVWHSVPFHGLLGLGLACPKVDALGAELGGARLLWRTAEHIGPPGDLKVGEPSRQHRRVELCFQQRTGNSTGPERYLFLRRLRHRCLDQDVPDL